MGDVKVNIDYNALSNNEEQENARERLERFIKKVGKDARVYGELTRAEYYDGTATTYSVGGSWYAEKGGSNSGSQIAYFENKFDSDSHEKRMRALKPSAITIRF